MSLYRHELTDLKNFLGQFPLFKYQLNIWKPAVQGIEKCIARYSKKVAATRAERFYTWFYPSYWFLKWSLKVKLTVNPAKKLFERPSKWTPDPRPYGFFKS